MKTPIISYAGKRVYIGIDVHREYFVASCMCEGVVIKRCRMPASAESIISLVVKNYSNSEVQTCYESGYSGFWLHRALMAAGISNIVVHAASIEIAANDRVKTDKRDSLKMAQQLAAGRLKGIRVPGEAEEKQRLLSRTREQLMRDKRRVQVQIRMRLHQFGLFPSEIKRVIRLKDAEELLKRLDGELKFSIERLFIIWQQLLLQVKEIDKRLIEQAKHDPLEVLYRSVPGIGPLTARVLSTELGDMSQFTNVRSLYGFTGLTPGEHSSGNKVYRGSISRQGSSRLRHLLVEAAWKAVRCDIEMEHFFWKIANRAGKRRAVVACARKLIGKVRAVVLSKTPYRMEYNKAA